MAKLFFDEFISFNQYDVDLNDDIFESILYKRKDDIDCDRFFLDYIPSSELDKYDFNDKDSLNQFRNVCVSYESPRKRIGGCNLSPSKLEEDIRLSGIKLSDPDKRVLGQFDVRNHIVTYSPIFPFFYDERDITKFARDTYFTSISFEELVLNQINHAVSFFVHVGDYTSARDIIKYGTHIMEEVSKEKMIEYLTYPESGEKVLKRILK